MAKKTNTSMYIVALVLFLGGVGYLAYSGFTESKVYFLNVSEALAASNEKLQSARLFGTVAADGLTRSGDGLGLRFLLEDKDDPARTLEVRYRGAVPDTFKPGAEVIVEGGLVADGSFGAKTLMTKCPSKYQKENRVAAK